MTKRMAVIGAGPMGLMAAYELLKAGHHVEVFEQDDRVGGMSASFDFDGLTIERFYHFICKGDAPLFALLDEMGLRHKVRWQETKMGYFYDGTLYKWGNPHSLLTFPKLSFVSKIRYALNIMYSQHIASMDRLDKIYAVPWLKRWLGKEAYALLWDRLLHLKYFEYTDSISASWIAARIRRVARSRKSVWTETMGYLENGSNTLMLALAEAIRKKGGIIHLRSGVQRVVSDKGRIRGVQVADKEIAFDAVISTVPLPYLTQIIPDLPADEAAKIKSIINIGVACVILKLNRRFSENFWLNVCDKTIDIPGLIEYSNLYPLGDHVIYAPYYMPPSHPKFTYSDEQFIAEVTRYMHMINPQFNAGWIKASHVHRYRYAQTVSGVEFMKSLPDMQSKLQGLFMADTAYYYPEDRSISESVNTAKSLVEKTLAWAHNDRA